MIRAYRIMPTDPPASLLKREPESSERRKDLGRSPRRRDEEHLAAIRQLPCIVCMKRPVEACHIRMSAPGKPNAGIGAKPDDRHVLPMCHEHHIEQHEIGERAFFEREGIAPLFAAELLYHHSPNEHAMLQIMRGIRGIAKVGRAT